MSLRPRNAGHLTHCNFSDSRENKITTGGAEIVHCGLGPNEGTPKSLLPLFGPVSFASTLSSSALGNFYTLFIDALPFLQTNFTRACYDKRDADPVYVDD